MSTQLPRILFIDGVPVNLKALGSVLEGEFELQFATSGLAGIALALKHPPDMILLDVMMPNMDGYETFRRLAAQPTLKDIPVVFVAALNDVESEVTGLELGAADCITKPINVTVARHRIRNLVERDRLRKKLELQRDQLAQELAQHAKSDDLLRKLSVAIEQSPASVAITDLDACLEYVNPRFTEVTGYSAREVVGKNPRILQSGQTSRATHQDMWDTLHRGQVWKGELVNRRKNGEVYWEESQIAPVRNAAGVVTHYVAVKTDITARKRAEAELTALRAEAQLGESRQRLRELAVQNEKAREEERKYVALELHDELGQVLTAMRMALLLMEMRFCPHDPALAKVVSDMKVLLDRAIQGTRDVVFRLRPAALDLGLVPGLEWLCQEFFRQTKLPCLLHVANDNIHLNEAFSIVVFRIVQESLTNVTRYAAASRVNINIRSCTNELVLEICDNGKGFDVGAVQKQNTFGLLGMRERANALGGRVDIESGPSQGTTVRVTIPTDMQAMKVTP